MTLTRTSAKNYFLTNLKPTQSQFAELFEGIIFQSGASAQAVQSNVSAAGTWEFLKDVSVSGRVSAKSLNVAGVVSAVSYNGIGTALTALNASNLSSGTVAASVTLRPNLVAYTRDTSITGSQALTGAGFSPRLAVLRGTVSGTKLISMGSTNGSIQDCIFMENATGNWLSSTTILLAARTTTGVTEAQAAFASFDVDGMTITWSKTGSPTGTMSFWVEYYP